MTTSRTMSGKSAVMAARREMREGRIGRRRDVQFVAWSSEQKLQVALAARTLRTECCVGSRAVTKLCRSLEERLNV
jgi:hypothetical protein